jgi:hypothetical protein
MKFYEIFEICIEILGNLRARKPKGPKQDNQNRIRIPITEVQSMSYVFL